MKLCVTSERPDILPWKYKFQGGYRINYGKTNCELVNTKKHSTVSEARKIQLYELVLLKILPGDENNYKFDYIKQNYENITSRTSPHISEFNPTETGYI